MDETYVDMEFEEPITIIMDVYLFLRMLRSDLRDSHIVVIYAGAAHSKRYSNLLKATKLGKVIWSHPMKLDAKCIEIPEKVSRQVEKMVQKLPRTKCSYSKKLEEKTIARQYKREDSEIRKAIEETSRMIRVPKNVIRSVVWESLLRE